MHSTPMIVESMSAISRRLRRPSAGTTLASIPGAASPRGSPAPASAISTALGGQPSRPRRRQPGRGHRRRDAVGRRRGDARRGGQHQNAAPSASDGGALRLPALVERLGHEERELQRLRRR